jgi:C4-dicarboxylate transporter DctM subunit
VTPLLCTGLLLFLLLCGVPIIYALGFSGLIVGTIAYGSPSLAKLGWITYESFHSLVWTPLPLFVLMACVITEAGIGKEVFETTKKYLSRIPGGLVSAGILAEGITAAAVGVSGACILAVGKVALPEFKRANYDETMSIGGLLCGGVLGPLIPPSTPLIIYGVIGGVSLAHLLVAGLLPGILLAFLLALVPVVLCARRPELGPCTESAPWKEKFRSLKNIWPLVLIMFSIIGSIYLGLATPSEAASVGTFVTILIAIFSFGLRFKGLLSSLREAAIINAMMLAVMVGAYFFSYVMGSSNIGKDLGIFVRDLGLPPKLVVMAIMMIILVMGCFLEALCIVALTVPIFIPLIKELGLDPVWFGVLLVVNTEIGLITPPMGINLFYVRNVFGIDTWKLLRGAIPYLLVLLLFLGIMIAFPQVSLWLPQTMITRR